MCHRNSDTQFGNNCDHFKSYKFFKSNNIYMLHEHNIRGHLIGISHIVLPSRHGAASWSLTFRIFLLLFFLGGLVDWPGGSQFQANKFKEASLPNIPSVSRYFRYENLLCVCQSNDIYLRQKKNSMHTTFVFYRLPSWTCYVRPWYFQS